MASLLEGKMTIRPDVTGAEFLFRLRDIVQASGTYQILDEGPWPFDKSYDAFLDIGLEEHKNPPNLKVVRLVSMSPAPAKVEVHLFALPEWPSDLTYANYTTTAREALRPILRAYNQSFGTRLKLHVPPPSRRRELPRGAKKLFAQYALVANKNRTHPLDWTRFYKLVIYCHDHHIAFDSEDMQDLLRETGFNQQADRELAAAYRHGRAILGLQSKARREWLWERHRHRGTKQNV